MPGKGDFISDGYALEHRVVGYLESNGWFPIKSHMSKGIIDVIGVKPGGEIKFIQCKLSEWGGDEFDELVELNERFEEATVEYAILGESNKLKFRDIEDMQSKEENVDISNIIDNSEETVEHVQEVKEFIEEETKDREDRSIEISLVVSHMGTKLKTTSDKIEDAIEKLKIEGDLFEPQQGYVQPI